MRMNQNDYKKYVEAIEPSSPIWKNLLLAFIVGGLICTIGEALLQLFAFWGFNKEQSGTLNCISLVLLSALLTAFGVYDKLSKHAGAGMLVPITGFANAVVSPAIEFKPEGMIFGVGAKIFSIAGPVITYGIIASVIAGLFYFFF